MLSLTYFKSDTLLETTLLIGWWNQFPTSDAEFKFAKIQNSHVEGGWVVGGWGGMETNFQLLMLSSNFLKSKIPKFRVGGGGGGFGGNQFPTFDVEFKFAKIQNSHVQGRGRGWWKPIFQLLMLRSNLLKSKIPKLRVGGVGRNQFLTSDAEFKFAKIQNSHVQGRGRGWWKPIFQLLMLRSNLLKSKIPKLRVGGVGRNQFLTSDAEFKFAEIQNSQVEGRWVGGVGGTNFELSMLSPNLLKSKIPMSRVRGGSWWNQFPTFDVESKFAKIQNSQVEGGWVWVGGGWWNQFPTFDAESTFAKIQNPHVQGGGVGELVNPTFNF